MLFNILLLPYHFCSSLQSQYNLTFFIPSWWFRCCLYKFFFIIFFLTSKCSVYLLQFNKWIYATLCCWLLLQVFHQRIDDMMMERKKMWRRKKDAICMRTHICNLIQNRYTKNCLLYAIFFHNAYNTHHIAFLILQYFIFKF